MSTEAIAQNTEPMADIPNVDEEKLLTQTDDAKVAEREILREGSKVIEQQHDSSDEVEVDIILHFNFFYMYIKKILLTYSYVLFCWFTKIFVHTRKIIM